MVDCQVYNDLDLIFGVDLSDQQDVQRVKDVVMSSLLDFMPAGVSRERMSGPSLSEAYVRKLVKVYDNVNRWSLISLSNVRARNVELKFADRMRRQFEFSVDSFQVQPTHLLLSASYLLTSHALAFAVVRRSRIRPLADLTDVALMLQCCVCLLSSSSVTLCIVAKRCVPEQKLLLTAYRKSYVRNRLVPK